MLWTLESIKLFCNYLKFLNIFKAFVTSHDSCSKQDVIFQYIFRDSVLQTSWFFLIHMVINWRQAREEWLLGVIFHLGRRTIVIVIEKIGEKQLYGIMLFLIF